MEWYVLIKEEIKADNLTKKEAFDICAEYSKSNPHIDACKILMCHKIKRKGSPERYCKSSFEDFHENGVYIGE